MIEIPRLSQRSKGALQSVLLLPCDTRPPTLELPLQLARVAGLEMMSPKLELLSELNIPGDTAALCDWLLEHVASVDVAIISLEMLCLGGLIPARRVEDSLIDALARLHVLTELKRLNPDLRILAHGVIVRVAHENDPLEEKPYYGEWGAELRRVSEWTDRVERGSDPQTLDEARANVPAMILEDWLLTRERNHTVHMKAIDLLAEGILEHLSLTLDDTTPYGLAARDRRRLERRLDELSLWSRADLYPGADEASCTLLARAITNTLPARPRVAVRYPSCAAEQAGMLYEDRPLGELVKAHLRACGCVDARWGGAPDLVLAVNAPAVGQAHRQPDFERVDTAARNLPEFIAGMKASPLPTIVADVAYANGAERRFTELLLGTIDVTTLAGYAAWNTAGNTLGSAIAFGVCSSFAQHPRKGEAQGARLEALFSRFVDDWLYQASVRASVREKLGNPSPFDLAELRPRAEAEIAVLMAPLAEELWEKHFAHRLPETRLVWGTPRLAWPRLFTGVFPFHLEFTT